MNHRTTILGVALCWSFCLPAGAQENKPLALHPDNPHYFLFRGKPAVLVGSTEHYGAVLNLDFDYVPYLDELAAHGLNQTRTFSGTYHEVFGSFGITENTLAPKPERYAAPWARSGQGGAGDGQNKWDLSRFDDEYFARLKDFVGQAARRGVVVEYVLFCTHYWDSKANKSPMWEVSPMNPKNTVTDLGGEFSHREALTLKLPKLLAIQEAFVKKAVTELNSFDNVYFEICNEPYFEDVSPEWQAHIAQVIADTEKGLPNRHLVAQNIANNQKKVEKVTPGIWMLNFHYARPPETVAMNYAHNVAIADDETGFDGKEDVHYRTEAWDFLMAGGAAYDNLDYSFSANHASGTLKEFRSPGGGSRELRRSLGALRKFMESLDLPRMKPANATVKGGQATVAIGARARTGDSARGGQITVRALAAEGGAYAVYVKGGSTVTLALELPKGSYRAEWVETRSGEVARQEPFEHEGGVRELASPAYSEDVALRVTKAN
jgi:hypothetical protein